MKFEKPLVEIKGFGGKLGLLLDGTAAFDQLEEELKKLLQRLNSRQFFKGAEIFLQSNGRRLNPDEFSRLQRILKREGDLHLVSETAKKMIRSQESASNSKELFADPSSSLERNRETAWFSPPQSGNELLKSMDGVSESLQAQLPMNKREMPYSSLTAKGSLPPDYSETTAEEERTKTSFESTPDSLFPIKGFKTTDALIVRQTMHSGQAFRSQSGVILMGDLNAGAEIVSDHDVVVLGTLRGTVHAGASGNRKALVFALRMQPTQLRIAELITQPSKEDKRSPRFESEIAFIEGESIIIETCQKIRL